MLLTIYGLPGSIKFQNLKSLIKSQSGLTDFILDNLIAEPDGCKKVRIGLANEAEGRLLVKCLDGYCIGGKNILRVEPIGKALPSNISPQANFDNQFLQPSHNMMGQNNFGHSQPVGQTHGHRMVTEQSWPTSSQWAEPMSQNNYSNFEQSGSAYIQQAPGYQGAMYSQTTQSGIPQVQQQPYGYTQNMSEQYNPQIVRPISALRSVELVESPMQHSGTQPSRYISDESYKKKSMVIMKENFQGSEAFSFNSKDDFSAQKQTNRSPWLDKVDIRDTMSGNYKDHQFDIQRREPGDDDSPVRRRMSPGDMRMPRTDKRESGSRRVSPGRRPRSPDRRPISPGRRHLSPRRNLSTGNRSISPGRRPVSPVKRPISPARRKFSPGRRPISLDTSSAKGREPDRVRSFRNQSPGEYDGRPIGNKFLGQASEQAYSGGSRQNVNEGMEYPHQSIRQQEKSMSVWQDKEDFYINTTTRDDRVLFIDSDQMGSVKSKSRRSRSPVRRERSPIAGHGRYKRLSSSPNPSRRALEKRSSPGARKAPPPPRWPGQTAIDKHDFKLDPPNIVDKKASRLPVWKDTPFESNTGHHRHSEDDRRPLRSEEIKHSPRESFKPIPELRSSPQHTSFSERKFHNEYDRNDARETPGFRQNKLESGRFNHRLEFEMSNNEGRTNYGQLLNEEIDDVHKRALEFSKKTEEFKREKKYGSDDRNSRGTEQEMRMNIDRLKQLEREESIRRRERLKDKVIHPEDRRFLQRDEKSHMRHDDKSWSNITDSRGSKRSRDENNEVEEKAALDIIEKFLTRYDVDFKGDYKLEERITEELKVKIKRMLSALFVDVSDISFIEAVIKFNAKYKPSDLNKIFDDILSRYPIHVRSCINLKRPRSDSSSIVSRNRAPNPLGNQDPVHYVTPQPQISDWDIPAGTAMAMNMSFMPHISTMPVVMDPSQMVYQNPVYTSALQEVHPQTIVVDNCEPQFQDNLNVEENSNEQDSLYLCKDDFEPFTDSETDLLRNFLVSHIIKETKNSNWAPDFTLKGMQTMCRYELVARDRNSRDWILKFDFSEFKFFNVLVYTKEELWYERAAIWLPGHSKYRTIQPLEKLKLQNRRLEGINIGKWKFVNKIITTKGTRLYVDMPPSSARALEKFNMMLSYELQKVKVFLKAIAVDKEAFDGGLKEPSLQEQSELITIAQNCPIPSIAENNKLVKFGLAGTKTLSLLLARKIKETIIYHIFKYHQANGRGRTDFVNFGLCKGQFAVLADNKESLNWLMELDLGKINKQKVIIIGDEHKHVKCLTMKVIFPSSSFTRKSERLKEVVFERLKRANLGVKGLNFNNWKPLRLSNHHDNTKEVLEVDIDMESIETIIKMNYKLEYIDSNNRTSTVTVISSYPRRRLEEKIKNYKEEMKDSYDVANMELSSNDEDEDDDVVLIE